MMQGLDVESARALTSAIAKMRETKESLHETEFRIDDGLKDRRAYLKHSLIKLKEHRDCSQNNVNELVNVLHELNQRNAYLKEQNRLAQETCLLVQVDGERMLGEAEKHTDHARKYEASILGFEVAKEEAEVKLRMAKEELSQKQAHLKALKSQQAQQLLEQKRVENAVNKIAQDSLAIKSILASS